MLGKSERPTELTGSIIDEQTYLQEHEHDGRAMISFHLCRLILLYTTKELEEAEESRKWFARKYSDRCESGNSSSKLYMFFLSALLCYSMARRTGKTVFRRTAQRYIKPLQALHAVGSPMTLHIMSFLKAEELSMDKAKNQSVLSVVEAYENAIKEADEGSFWLAKAWACERAAEFLIASNSPQEATRFLQRSYQYYVDYGAVTKQRRLEQEYGAGRVATKEALEGISPGVKARQVQPYLLNERTGPRINNGAALERR